MMNAEERNLLLRYLAVEQFRYYENQLIQGISNLSSFHLELHGTILAFENAQKLIQALMQCNALEFIFLDNFQCHPSTWLAIDECLQALLAPNENKQTSSQQFHRLMIRRIRILSTVESNLEYPRSNNDDNVDDDKLDEESGVLLLARSLSRLLRSSSYQLLECNLFDCGLTSHEAQIMFSNSFTNTSLRLLSLHGNSSIGNTGIKFLADALPNFPHLHTLCVERVGLSQSGFFLLLDAIRNHPQLRYLLVMGNFMDVSTIEYLIDMLTHDNLRLHRIQWDPTETNHKNYHKLIVFWLRTNRAGRRWVLQHTYSGSSASVWPLVLEKVTSKDPSILYFFIRSRPEYCCSTQDTRKRND